MKKLRDGLPKGAHDACAQQRLTTNWAEYFPGLTKCPPIIYLDLWPFLSYPLIYATSLEACYQIIQEKPQPRHGMFAWALLPVNTFVQQLRDMAGRNHEYGKVFPLYERTVNLTFDIIMRVVVDLRVNERLIRHVKAENIRNITSNEATIRGILLLHLKSRLGKEMDSTTPRTVIDLALKALKSESRDAYLQPNDYFFFSTVCWVFYEVYSRPKVLESLRAELDVLGPDPMLTLAQQPHKLNTLQYITAVIKEILCLHPLGATHRLRSSELNIMYEGITYPTMNALINTSPTALHLRADLWPRVNEFLPERFIVPEGHPLHPIRNVWRAFELGNTRCIGEELAMMEMKLVLILTARDMDMEFDWVGWNKSQNRTSPPDMVNGHYMYRVGNGIGTVKDRLPTRIRLR
ncbi:cytochrome P450 [Xylaria sp. FL1042]|nr:cytochrome P450 [Xylaria sp. FL1042]